MHHRGFKQFKTPREQLESQEWNDYITHSENQYTRVNCQQMMKNPLFLDGLKAPDGYKFVQLDFCCHPEVEILTPRGWTKFQDLTPEDKVYQVDPISLTGQFVFPDRIINTTYKGNMNEIGNRRGTIRVTDNHKMLYVGQRHKKRKDKEKLRWTGYSHEDLPSSGCHLAVAAPTSEELGKTFPIKEIEMACMLQADSSITPYGKYTISVIKKAKRKEVTRLLERPGIVRAKRACHSAETESWYGINFTSELLEGKFLHLTKVSRTQAPAVLEALAKWDSSLDSHGAVMYATSVRRQAEEVQAYFVTAGYEARISVTTFENPRHNDSYTVTIRNKDRFRLSDADTKVSWYEGPVGCVTVPKGHILVRDRGQTFVIGNCALEPNVMAEFSEDPVYKDLYASGKPHDVYLYVVCRLLDPTGEITGVYLPDNPTPESIKAAKKQFKKQRTIGKVVHLASTYKAGAAKIWRTLKLNGVDLSKEEVEHLREEYWGPKLFKGILDFEHHLLAEVQQRDGWFINGTGRPLSVTEKKSKDVLNIFCLAEDTLVYTKEGPKKISCVTSHDMVWYKGQWVSTKGAIRKGYKPTINLNGVYMTLDHKVLTTQGLRDAGQIKEDSIRISDTTRPKYGWKEVWRFLYNILNRMSQR